MNKNNARPFIKWVGGKTQLLKELQDRLPTPIIENGKIKRYIEPFIGGGAFFFFLKNNYNIKKAFIFDINPELIIAYRVVQRDHEKLVNALIEIEDYHLQKSESERKEHYYHIRKLYNQQMQKFDYDNYNLDWIERTKYLIFLNKTCYNGLYRQNLKGEFNVPFGRYKNPKVLDESNLIAVNKALQNTEIYCADFKLSEKYIEKENLVYLDPPYRPLSKTSNFTTYAKNGFLDEDQLRLADFFHKMNKRGAYLMLSNSDPKNIDNNDYFFDDAYRGYKIDRIPAKRNINSNILKRGEISELIITNY
ncbi:DNA adenine methylase [Methanobacterium sp. ACI-7]|uniref:DNA adenine methylase n=1 Tax=unclassified Methanobacterium TaxID=2627676 RepID=UPI0039C3136F